MDAYMCACACTARHHRSADQPYQAYDVNLVDVLVRVHLVGCKLDHAENLMQAL